MERKAFALLVCLATLAHPIAAHAEPAHTQLGPGTTAEARLSGAFRFAELPGERAALTAAIERSVDKLFFALRGIARRRLADKTKIASAVTLRFEGDTIRCGIPGAPDAVSPADGRPVDYTVDGETVKLSQRMDNGRLVQWFRAADGARSNTYVPSDDGSRMTMEVNITSPKLPTSVMYSLTYARTP
jgi:hypothetical protein